jgi:two-component system cell cycle sensor histidine kinase/response regulator CckA
MTVRKNKPGPRLPAVLAVDDEPNVLEFMRAVLGRSGFTVMVAKSGHEALEVFQRASGQVDVLVSDVVMPVMDGPTLVRELMKQKPGLPVLFVSGYVGRPEFKKASGARRLDVLPKPFSPDVLVQSVRRLLPA